MKQPWTFIVPFMLSLGTVACSTTEHVWNVNSDAAVASKYDANALNNTLTPAKHTSDGKLILGTKEWVYLPALQENFQAHIRFDIGISSINVSDVTVFERNKKSWVTFKIKDNSMKVHEMSLPVARWLALPTVNKEEPQQRAVVTTWIQIGDRKEEIPFVLNEQSHSLLPIQLNHQLFASFAIINDNQIFIQDRYQQ